MTPEQAARVEVRGVDQVVRAVVAAVDGPPGAPLGDREQEALWEEAVRSSDRAAPTSPRSSPRASWRRSTARSCWGCREHTRAEYLRVKRAGRGVRLNRVQRAAVWNVVEAFERARAGPGADELRPAVGPRRGDPRRPGVAREGRRRTTT